MKRDFLVFLSVVLEVVYRVEGDWTSVLNVTRTGREGDIFTERVDTCSSTWNGYCSERKANRRTWRAPDGRQLCMCQCYTWFNTYLSDEDECKNVPNDPECEDWTFADQGRYLYTVSPDVGYTGRVDWSDYNWPGSGVSPDSCSIDWSCYITSQKFLEDGKWKDMSCLGGNVPEDVFSVDSVDVGRRRSCERHWYVSWDVDSYDVSLLGGVVLHLDVTCTRPRFGNRQYKKKECLHFKTEGTHLYNPGRGCSPYIASTPPGQVTTQTTQPDITTLLPDTSANPASSSTSTTAAIATASHSGGASGTPAAGITQTPGAETTQVVTTVPGNGTMDRNTGGGNTGAVVGGVAVAVIVILALLGGFVLFWRRKHTSASKKPSGSPPVIINTLQNPGYGDHMTTPQNNRISTNSAKYVDNTAYVGYSTGGTVDNAAYVGYSSGQSAANAIYEEQAPEYAYTDVQNGVVPSAPMDDNVYQPYQPYDQVPLENTYSSPDGENIYAQLNGTQERPEPSAPLPPYAESAGVNHYTSLTQDQENVYQDLGPQYEELPAFNKGPDTGVDSSV